MSGDDRRSILIVGGGTAGWLSAAYLARKLGTAHSGGLDITVLESPEIGSIGVGEGAFPTIRNTLRTIGVDEGAFMRAASATFKQGIYFADWERTPENGQHSHFVHPFDPPFWDQEEVDLVPYWLLMDPGTRPGFADAVSLQKRVADARKGPKHIHQGHFTGPLNYAYHFDATGFADMLAQQARSMGVKHLRGTLKSVKLNEDGSVDHVVSAEHGILKAAFYIDCTGFRSEILGKALNVPFMSAKETLFTDSAITLHVPYDRPQAPIASYTHASAREAGWIWDIGLSTRKGIGYVYSSDHTDDARAEEVLRQYAGPLGQDAEARLIRFNPGYRQSHWVKNVLGVGLSAGFLEPLEATGLVLVESAISEFAEFFPHSGPVDASAAHFNDMMVKRYTAIIGFLKMHYAISRRTEPFWRDNREATSIPDHLATRLDLWKRRPPSRFDFIIDTESFAHFSYQYILYGMNYATDFEAARRLLRETDKAQRIFAKVRQYGEMAQNDLPSHRNLIEQIGLHGFMSGPQRAAQ